MHTFGVPQKPGGDFRRLLPGYSGETKNGTAHGTGFLDLYGNDLTTQDICLDLQPDVRPCTTAAGQQPLDMDIAMMEEIRENPQEFRYVA